MALYLSRSKLPTKKHSIFYRNLVVPFGEYHQIYDILLADRNYIISNMTIQHDCTVSSNTDDFCIVTVDINQEANVTLANTSASYDVNLPLTTFTLPQLGNFNQRIYVAHVGRAHAPNTVNQQQITKIPSFQMQQGDHMFLNLTRQDFNLITPYITGVITMDILEP